jgi:hypothetical protein
MDYPLYGEGLEFNSFKFESVLKILFIYFLQHALLKIN